MTATTISSTLAGFATSLNYQNIPPEVAANAKLRLLDTVGVCLASIGMPYANAILGHVEEQGGRAESRLFGRDTRLPATLAVLYNAALAHGNDYDDTHSRAIVHAGAVMVPTALAMAERHSRSGRDALAAIGAGYKIAARSGMMASKGFHAQGFHAQGFHSNNICGTFAAAATASMLMGLNQGSIS